MHTDCTKIASKSNLMSPAYFNKIDGENKHGHVGKVPKLFFTERPTLDTF